MPTRALFACALALFACGDYTAVLHVTLEGERPPTGGGYRLEVRRANGARLSGTREVFVERKSGAQDVALVIEDDEAFGDSDALELRVYAEAASSDDGEASGIGTAVARVERGGVTEVEVTLRDPPAAEADVQAVLLPEGIVHIDVVGALAPRSGHRLDLWVERDGASTRLGRLDEGATSEIDADGARIGDLFIVEEPASSTGDLARPNGWELYRGGLPSEAADLLAPILDGGEALERALTLVDVGVAHSILAFEATTSSGVLLHTEHTFNCVAGEERADEDLIAGAPEPDGDINDTGKLEFPSSDEEGLGAETAGDERGYLGRIEPALEELFELPSLPAAARTAAGNALACLDDTRSAIGELYNAALLAAATPPEGDRQGLVDAMAAILGASATPQTMSCVTAELHAMTPVTLAPVVP